MFKTAIACLLGSASAALNEDFKDYLHGKKLVNHGIFMKIWQQFDSEYGAISPNADADKVDRMQNFENTLHSIIEHNSKPGVTYKKGINKFSDMSEEQFRAHFNIRKNTLTTEQHCSATDKRVSVNRDRDVAVPKAWDWRQHKGVSPVKDQGHCGSCWTFSTVGCLEAHTLIAYGSTDYYAEQQLVDCAQAYDNHGCNGGLPSHAFEYIEAAGGISTEDAYPYKAKDQNCTVKKDSFKVTVRGGSVNITEGDETELRDALFFHGPVSIAFQVVDGFKDYESGVYTSDTCKNGTGDVNHAVLAVGFGEENGVPYWIVKNSWSANWGDNGFFKIQRGNNMCGVAMCNSFPARVHKINQDTAFLQ